jgi:cold shock CspA family protein
VEKQLGHAKSHPERENVALEIRLNAEEGYGFIKTREGRELYFHRNSFLNDGFDRLVLGTAVRFTAAEGEEGPQASPVQATDKPSE